MPSGIDAALAKLKTDDKPGPVKITYNGFQDSGPKKPVITEATIDAAELGLEACQKRLKEQEFKMKKIQDAIAALPPTKKNKPDIADKKVKLQTLQYDGNYRAALDFVRKHEEREKERLRDEGNKNDEDLLVGGALKGKKEKDAEAAPGVKAAAKKKDPVAAKPVAVEIGPFEADAKTAAVVKSAVEGSVDAQLEVQKPGGAEVPTIIHAANSMIAQALKRANTREHALRTIRCLLWNPAAVLPAFPAVLNMLDETKLKSEASGKVTELCVDVAKSGVSGKAMPQYVLPVLLDYMGAAATGRWQVKVGAMGVLKQVLQVMNEPGMCPTQLGLAMPKVMSALRGAVGDARKEVKKEAEILLRHLGSEMVKTPEIMAMQEDIISSIIDSANMEKAATTMHRLANTTFMNTMDSCSFGLLFPIVARALRESNHEAKTKGVVIVGASVNLIADPRFLEPYVAELMPLLKESLMHPTPAIQRAAAQSFGALSRGLPWLCAQEIYPYLMEKLETHNTDEDVSEVDRRGAAHGLCEVMLARRDLFADTLYKEILPRIQKGKLNETKAGALCLLQHLGHHGTAPFLPHLPHVLQAVLDALSEESEVVTRHAAAAVKVFIEEYGATYPRLLLPRLQQALFVEREEARELVMDIFFAFCEKLSDSVKFGQDFLTVESLPVFYRHSLLSSIFIARSDSNYAVRRQASLLWKEKLQSQQKAKLEILPVLLQIIKALKASSSTRQSSAADAVIAENKEDIADGALDPVTAITAPESGINAGVIFAGSMDVLGADTFKVEETPEPPQQRGRVLADRVETEVKKVGLVSPVEWYILEVISSCCLETRTREAALKAIEEELLPLADKAKVEKDGSAVSAFGLNAAIDEIFKGVEDEVDKVVIGDKNSDILLRIDDVMLMYGGGHLLLKNTRLELRRGHCYGVVGRNGAGKTTLMSTIGSGGIAQIPKSVKTLHVRPEVLVDANELTAVEFCKRDCDKGESSDKALHAALSSVGYPENMHSKLVSELSGGWRMKLLIASAMMRECDILLLDEPTNHLDKASVQWLVDYLKSLKTGAIMVISHDPAFLNAVCTDIIQYSSQRTLDYYKGDFEDFRRQRQITSDEEAEALLLGQDYSDLKPGGSAADAPAAEASAEKTAEAGGEEVTGLTANVLDKQAKVTFPIPGKLQGHSTGKAVMELTGVHFAYDEQQGPWILKDISCRLTLNSRVGIIGKNGAGKSTLLNLLCGELWPSPNPSGGKEGEVYKNRNLRLAYIAQQHMYHLADFQNSSPYVYIQNRFKNGWDETLQDRLILPSTPEEAERVKELAVKYGKYGNAVRDIVGRIVKGNEVLYEVAWMNLEDQKQNTMETVSKLKMMGVSAMAKAYDERLAAQAAGIDQRPLSEREIIKHLEQFGLDEELILNRLIGTFSAGQKSKLTLGAAFWTKPHMVALDEPTNYIDMETLDALANGLQRFKGGIVVISHSNAFVERVCEETWLVEQGEGGATITKTKKTEKK